MARLAFSINLITVNADSSCIEVQGVKSADSAGFVLVLIVSMNVQVAGVAFIVHMTVGASRRARRRVSTRMTARPSLEVALMDVNWRASGASQRVDVCLGAHGLWWALVDHP